MGYSTRKDLYKKLEDHRERPLISYVTSIRPNISSQMAGDAISVIIDQVRKIPREKKEVDFLIISNGGDPITALRIVGILRERFDKITVIAPYVAYSAATILALGADEIMMHPFSNLGPVDPQITVTKQGAPGQSSNFEFSSEDIRNYIDFIKSDVGITDQGNLVNALNYLVSEIGPIPIGLSKRSQQLSLSLSIKMLNTHMDDKEKVESIAQALNTSYYHHGYAVDRREAVRIGLNVAFPDIYIEDLMWEIWEDFKREMKCDSDFNPINEIMSNDEVRCKFNAIPILNIPANCPPEIAQPIIQQVVQQNIQICGQESIEINQLMASIESINMFSSVETKLNIAYWRNTNMELAFGITSYSDGWQPRRG